MTLPENRATDDDPDSNWRWSRQYIVAVGLVVGFGILAVVLLFLVNGDEVLWQRRVYVFSAVEALVFTAVGWLFGREVNRSALASSREEAKKAQKDAADTRAVADRAIAESARNQVAATEARAKAAAVVAIVESTKTANPNDPSSKVPDRDVVQLDLKSFIERLYRT